jgi:uncharacterized membrane protein
MTAPDPQYEKKVLSDVVNQMADPVVTMEKQKRMKKAIFGVGTIGLVVAFILAMNELVHAFASAFLAAAAGIAIGFALFLEFAHKQWPITRNHIDMDSVQNRLDELEI